MEFRDYFLAGSLFFGASFLAHASLEHHNNYERLAEKRYITAEKAVEKEKSERNSIVGEKISSSVEGGLALMLAGLGMKVLLEHKKNKE
jgi:hypothetical protein